MALTDLTLKKVNKVLKALEECGMSVLNACKQHDLSRPTFYAWVNEAPENKEKFYNILDSRTMEVEDSLYTEALDGNTVAMIFWLKNRGQGRWVDRTEVKQDITIDNDSSRDQLATAIGKVAKPEAGSDST